MTAAQRADLERLAAAHHAALSFERPLAELTTWHIGGPAEAVAEPADRAGLAALAGWARRGGVPLRVLGNGSNVLCPDQGVRGLVLRLASADAAVSVEGRQVSADAGAFLPKLARETAQRGLAGLECVVGVPGTVGGGCVLNAGVPSGTLGDVVVDVHVLLPDGSEAAWSRTSLALGHRESRLQHEDVLVLGARFELRDDDPAAVRARIDEHMAYRKRTQPLNLPSCGSVFRRPDVAARPDVPPYPGALIEAVGAKGLRQGDAEVSTLHANWIVNHGSAQASDVRWLMAEIRRRVADRFGVELVAEVIVWD